MAEKTVPTLHLLLGGQPVLSQIPSAQPRSALGDRTNTTGSKPTVEAVPERGDDDEYPLDPEEEALLDEMEAELFGDEGDDGEQEDAPDWEFERGETVAADKTYVFTPAPHRRQLLRVVAKAFCRHPIFPTQAGQPDAKEVRLRAVHEMYKFCHARGLTETWGYFWTNWYSPSRWSLWARSSSPRLSRLRTTMTAENHFRQLKGDHLHFLHRPRLDHTVWVLATQVVPAYMARAEGLEDTHHVGRGKPLSQFQRGFKTDFKKKQKMKISNKVYKTDVKKWLCDCGAQELSAYHCCKHLVQAVPDPPPEFYMYVVRRRTVPLYRSRHLYDKSNPLGRDEAEKAAGLDGSVSDGDDHVFDGVGKWRVAEVGR